MSDIEGIPIDILETYASAVNESLPDKSHKRYMYVYDVFMKWRGVKQTTSFGEPVLLAYFHELSTKYKPSSLWSTYSMLKSTLICKHNVNISDYSQLISYLKKKADGFESKKSKVTKSQQIFGRSTGCCVFSSEDSIIVFGVIGACRGDELMNIKTVHVKDNGNEIIVKIPESKTKVSKIYTIDGRFAEIVRKYMSLRPIAASTDRFFLRYHNGKCTVQVIGKNSIAKMPKQIATFLESPESETYTGHSFRRTSATILADTGVGIETLKRHGQWKSNKVAEGYVQESLGHKRKIGSLIAEAVNLPPTATIVSDQHESAPKKIATITSSELSSVVQEEIIESSTRTHTVSLSQKVASTAVSENQSMCEIEGKNTISFSNCGNVSFTFNN